MEEMEAVEEEEAAGVGAVERTFCITARRCGSGSISEVTSTSPCDAVKTTMKENTEGAHIAHEGNDTHRVGIMDTSDRVTEIRVMFIRRSESE